MKVINIATLLTVMLSTVAITNLPVRAEKICKVTDPTGTPLNVRDRPNGKIINKLKNGRKVDILEISSDSKGRPWAKVGGDYNGQYKVWGWVIREFISCYNQ
jgi:Bacterial SH3 domain